MPEDQEQLLDFYSNSVSFQVTAYDVMITFAITTEPGKPPKPLVRIRMSPQHALVMAKLFERNMLAYRENIGKINLPPRLYQDLGLEVE
ncbi:MAG: DUF3467 domain-containing protein [candidate division NC10 bacterium]|nr:DUF3467 domain-containing protein [candidate division NC10 bacterium]